MKQIGINLIRHVQNLYEENYKTLMKEIKEDLNNEKKLESTGRLNIMKMSVFPQTDLSNAVAINIPA